MGFHPKPRQGNVVKVSSLREDGYAAALSWRYSYPCTPICRTMNMVLRYRVEGVTPSWEFEGETLKVLGFEGRKKVRRHERNTSNPHPYRYGYFKRIA